MPGPKVEIDQPVDETGESYRRMREPGTLAILGLNLAGLGFARRKQAA